MLKIFNKYYSLNLEIINIEKYDNKINFSNGTIDIIYFHPIIHVILHFLFFFTSKDFIRIRVLQRTLTHLNVKCKWAEAWPLFWHFVSWVQRSPLFMLVNEERVGKCECRRWDVSLFRFLFFFDFSPTENILKTPKNSDIVNFFKKFKLSKNWIESKWIQQKEQNTIISLKIISWKL